MSNQHIQKAAKALRAGDIVRSKKICNSILKKDPNNIDALGILAKIELNNGEYRLAVALLNKIILAAPENAHYQYLISSAYLNMRMPERAIKHLRIAVKIEPGHGKAWSLLCGAVGQLGLLEEAISAGEIAVRINPKEFSSQMNLATAYETYGLIQNALSHYKEAIKISPKHPVVLCKLADSYISTGDRAAAEIYYRKAVSLHPRYTQPYRQLSRMKRYSDPNDKDISLILGMTRDINIPESERSNLHFALGKIYEDCGLYEESFHHLSIANSIENKKHAFNPTAFSEYVTRLISLFTPDFIQAWKEYGDPTTKPVFIIGMPRSGSTLLEQIIARHPKAYGAGELYWFGQVESRLQELLSTTVQYPDCVHDISKESIRTLSSDYLKYLETLTENKNYERITDKLLGNFLHAGLISIMFPNARILHCRRNPLDTCFSIYSILFPGNVDFGHDLYNLGFVYNEYARLMHYWEKTLKDQMLTIDYEEIVTNNEVVSRRVIDFIGMEWNDACLKISNSNTVSTVSAFQVRRDIYKSSIGRWRKYENYLRPLIEVLDTDLFDETYSLT